MGFLALLVGGGWCQPPTVFFGARLNPQMRFEQKETLLRWYTDKGEHSVVFLRFYFENHYSLYLAQRLQRIPGDADGDSMIDELYGERIGGWRVGKFYLPFGTGWLFRESVIAIQAPSRFAIGALPMQVAYVFNGATRQQGFLTRVGTSRGGVSMLVGRHFGINATAFTPWRLPEETLPREGYAQLYGADYQWDWGDQRLSLEWVGGYNPGKLPTVHYFAVRWQGLIDSWEPEVGLVYQTDAGRFAWRVALSLLVTQEYRLIVALRTRTGQPGIFSVALQGGL